MDGRDLSPSIILKWTKELSLLGIANTIPIFIKKENKIRIDHDIKELDSLPKGIYTKTKYNENEEAYLIKIMVDKNAISIENTNKIYSTIPDVINFLMIIDYCYPEKPPKVLCQTNVSIYYLLYILII